MPESINRLLADGAQTATVEFVSTGTIGGESGDILDTTTLSGSSDTDSVHNVRISKIIASVSGEEEGVNLIWSGSEDVFMTLGRGVSTVEINCEVTSGFTGTIRYDAPGNTPFTLRLYLEKLTGFPKSMAKINTHI